MSIPRHFDSFTSARTNLRSVLDAAHEGVITTVVRENERFVVVAADSLRRELSQLLPSRTAVVAEGGGWSAILPGVPVHGDAETFDEAIDDLIDALREYAEDQDSRHGVIILEWSERVLTSQGRCPVTGLVVSHVHTQP